MHQRLAVDLTLREFFDRVYAPGFLVEAAAQTRHGYLESLAHWQRITCDPPLCQIDGQTLAAFKAALRAPGQFGRRIGRPSPQRMLFEDLESPDGPHDAATARPLAAATVNKHLRHVGAMLNKAGPAGPGNRDALGLLAAVPWTRPCRIYRRLPKQVTAAAIASVYRATGRPGVVGASPIEGVPTRDWWRAFLVVAATTGFRRGALLSLRWSWVDLPAGQIRLPAEQDKCGADRRKPLSRLAVRHLLKIRHRGPLVFPWPMTSRSWYRQWHRICAAAGLGRRELLPHDLKRFCATELSKIASPWVVQRMCDHASLATSSYYVNPSDGLREPVERLADRLAGALEAVEEDRLAQ